MAGVPRCRLLQPHMAHLSTVQPLEGAAPPANGDSWGPRETVRWEALSFVGRREVRELLVLDNIVDERRQERAEHTRIEVKTLVASSLDELVRLDHCEELLCGRVMPSDDENWANSLARWRSNRLLMSSQWPLMYITRISRPEAMSVFKR
jgi:hypothetical protein